MKPLYRRRRLRTVANRAGQIQVTAPLDVAAAAAQDSSHRHWNITVWLV